MAADWIKMAANLSRVQEVITISRLTKSDKFTTIGRLWCFWCWTGDNSTDGTLRNATREDIDHLVEKQGFAHALEQVGWLEVADFGVTIPKWDRHNGSSAKKRAIEASRQGRLRTAKSQESVTENRHTSDHPPEKCHADSVTKSVRERDADTDTGNENCHADRQPEKNRIDIIHPPYPPTGGEAGERGWTFPQNLQTPAFKAAWDTWLGYTAQRNGGHRVPIMTLERHMLKCHELGPTDAARAIENAIAKNFREPALPGSFQPAAPKPEAPRFNPT